MERIKRFLLVDSGTAEASSIIIMIAAVGIMLGAGLAIYYGGANGFFNQAGGALDSYAAKIPQAK
jgi:hypothetical protein